MTLRLSREELAERDACKLQAQCHAQEARTANATISEIYQLCTGATGELGNWNGAEPVRKLVAERDALKALLREFCDDAMLANWNLFRTSSRSHMSCSLERDWLQRVIAALDAVKEKP